MEERELLEETKRAEEIKETVKTMVKPGQETEWEPTEELRETKEVEPGEESEQRGKKEPAEELRETEEVKPGEESEQRAKKEPAEELQKTEEVEPGEESEQGAKKESAEELRETEEVEPHKRSAETDSGPTLLQFEPQFGQQRKQTWSYNLVPKVVPSQPEGKYSRTRKRRKWEKVVFGRKLIVVICLGLIFGVLAGTGFYVTNRILDSVHPTAKVHIAVTGEKNRKLPVYFK